jgi:hypothetical protein
MNVKELIELLQKLPAYMEIMMPLESNVDRPKAVYIAKVAKTRRDWTMAPVGNFVVLDNDEISRREDTTGDPFQVVILDVDWPTWLYTDSDGRPVVINQQQVDTLRYRGLTVPVWQAKPGKGHSTAPFIRYSDLPADLIEAFERWQHEAKFGETPPPFHRTACDGDFLMFMKLDDDSNNADILARYR